MEALRQGRPRRRQPCKRIPGLAVYRGYMCEADGAQCDFVTRRRSRLQEHWTQHGLRALQHDSVARTLWSTCWLQTYFTAKGKIDYFTVLGDDLEEKGSHCTENGKEDKDGHSSQRPPLGGSQRTPHVLEPYQAFMDALVADAVQAKHEMDEIALAVPDVGDDRADEDSWVLQTGIGAHLQGLLDKEIQSSYALPAARNMLSGKMEPSPSEGRQG